MTQPPSRQVSPHTSTQPGFAHPVLDSQRVFRAAAEAMSRPGLPQSLGHPGDNDLTLPTIQNVHPASLAFLLALADLESPIWLDERLRHGDLPAYLRFHTGAEIVSERPAVSFALLPNDYKDDYLGEFAIGQEAYPELSTTVLIQVTDFNSGPPHCIRGPGIETTETLYLSGLSPRFWTDWQANQALYPCGVDVIFTAGYDLIGLPRSVHVED